MASRIQCWVTILVIMPLIYYSKASAHSIDCNESSVPGTIENSPKVGYFRDLFNRGTSAPLQDFLTLWGPEDPTGVRLDSPFFDCQRGADQAFGTASDENTTVPFNCRPDVLFSWSNTTKIKHLFDLLRDGQSWSGPLNHKPNSDYGGVVFTSISPASTFGYGRFLVRFKIKPDTTYKFYKLPQRDTGYGEVGVQTGFVHDFDVLDAAVLESASFGTPEIYDEIVRDVRRYASGRRVIFYVPNDRSGIERLFNQPPDISTQTEETLKNNLLELIHEILNGEGRIVYQKGSCRDRAKTFSTAFPSYYQPRGEIGR